MGIFNWLPQMPFTDNHQLNLDWIISKIRNIEDAEAAAKASENAASQSAITASESASSAADSASLAENYRDEAQDAALAWLEKPTFLNSLETVVTEYADEHGLDMSISGIEGIEDLFSDFNGFSEIITGTKYTNVFIPKGNIFTITNNGANTHWVELWHDLDKTVHAMNGQNYNSGQSKTYIAPMDIFVVQIDGGTSDINFDVVSVSDSDYNEQDISDIINGINRTIDKNINRVFIPAGTPFTFKNLSTSRWYTFYQDLNMTQVAIAGRNYATDAEKTWELDVPVRVVVADGYTGTIQMALKSYPKDEAEIVRNRFDTILRTKPRIDHLFVNDTTGSMTIPHESLAHVGLSKWAGFDMIEANIWKTSDDVFIVNHLSNGKFGNYFVHVDGVTDISNIEVANVTWDYIKNNVVYNSTIDKYKTPPPTLEEFLAECKKNELIPIVTGDLDALDIVDKYMGPFNYIVTNISSRKDIPPAIIVNFKGYTTKEAILTECREMGRPFIYCMSNPSAFTKDELTDIAGTLHDEGYFIGTAYDDEMFDYYQECGFEQFGATTSINRITNPDEHLTTLTTFDGFTTTNATINNGVLEFSGSGTITPNVTAGTHDICLVDVTIEYEGSITFPAYGERRIAFTRTHSERKGMYHTVVGINTTAAMTLSAASGTKIYNIDYKVKY